MTKFEALLLSACFVAGTRVLCPAQAVRPLTEGARPQLAVGQVIETVICEKDPTESYALYLPFNYTTTRHWPIVYFFDPGAHGKRPVELYKGMAEKYEFVFAGSNNSRNFSNDDSARSMTAMWQDTHSRLVLDERRTYTSGFSGGARMAGAMALSCERCQIAGVIAHGAGYPSLRKAGAGDGLLYFFAVGERDFNWPEVIGIRREREEQGLRYRVRTFPGGHQWAPVEVMEDAIEWMMLNAMRSGREAPDAAFIDGFFRRMQTEAQEAEKANDSIAQLMAYRSLISDFSGLKEVAEYDKKLASLKKSAELKAALEKEREQIAEQGAIVGEILPKIRALVDGSAADESADELTGLRTEVTQRMAVLRREGERAKNESQRLVSTRAFSSLWVEGIESGQMEFASGHFDKAEGYFQLMSSVSDDPWPVLLLAETRLAKGNKKQAIKDLREVVRRGVKDPELIEKDDKLQGLKTDRDFQKIVEELRRTK